MRISLGNYILFKIFIAPAVVAFWAVFGEKITLAGQIALGLLILYFIGKIAFKLINERPYKDLEDKEDQNIRDQYFDKSMED